MIFLCSCAGYRVQKKSNPFEQYGIHSVSIPTFVNRTSLANISRYFSREIILSLSQYPGLKVLPGESTKGDAILLGILTSSAKYRDVVRGVSKIYTTEELEDAIGARSQFYIPNTTRIKLELQIVLIKNPTLLEKKLARNGVLSKVIRSPKILINATIPVVGEFTRTAKGGLGNVVNFTSNHALLNRSVKQMAENAAKNFKETIANAF